MHESTMMQLTADLTPRQLDVLLRAIGEGYYASPRRTSTQALAATFGVTRSTFEEHLRKAERRVLERFADQMVREPDLRAFAARGPGRPRGAPLKRPPQTPTHVANSTA